MKSQVKKSSVPKTSHAVISIHVQTSPTSNGETNLVIGKIEANGIIAPINTLFAQFVALKRTADVFEKDIAALNNPKAKVLIEKIAHFVKFLDVEGDMKITPKPNGKTVPNMENPKKKDR